MKPPTLTCAQWKFSFDGHIPAELSIGPLLLLLVADGERKKPELIREDSRPHQVKLGHLGQPTAQEEKAGLGGQYECR